MNVSKLLFRKMSKKGKSAQKSFFFYSKTVQNHKIRLLTEIEVYDNLIISKT